MKSLLLLILAGALALALSACSKQETATSLASPSVTAAPAAAATTSASIYDTVANTGKGFTVGSLMSAQAVYVIFEPQCPHCGKLWQASIPLHSKVKFVWLPVSFSAKSLPQAAALMSAPNPVETMSSHEESLLSGKGGLAAPDNVPDQLQQAIKNNAQLLTALGADSVPFILAKNRQTGQIVSYNGALETVQLAQLLGI
ncbi:MAG: thioredoxin fold domain-containing protein [Rhodoferax sp.]|nr:thioredoxin fold domain-containing protein [Rhodoferax sp.]